MDFVTTGNKRRFDNFFTGVKLSRASRGITMGLTAGAILKETTQNAMTPTVMNTEPTIATPPSLNRDGSQNQILGASGEMIFALNELSNFPNEDYMP